jgi:hypothetical protein
MKLMATIGVGADETEKSEIRNFAPLVRYPKKNAVQSGRISRFGYKEKFCVLFSLSMAHTSN